MLLKDNTPLRPSQEGNYGIYFLIYIIYIHNW